MQLKLFLISIFVLLTLVGYKSYSETKILKSIDSYESCIAAKGSVIQESYPATCVTSLGSRFIEVITHNNQSYSGDISQGYHLTSLKEISGYTTFIEPRYNFSFEYPSNLTIIKLKSGPGNASTQWSFSDKPLNLEDDKDSIYAQMSDAIYLLPHATQKSMVDYAKSINSQLLVDSTIVGSKSAIRTLDHDSAGYVIDTEFGAISFSFNSVKDGEINSAIQHILDSFKFTD